MQTTRLVPNVATRAMAALRKKRSTETDSVFSLASTPCLSPINMPTSISTTLPLPPLLSEQDKQALHKGKICVDALEKWRRTWLFQADGNLDDLKEIQKQLDDNKSSSSQIQKILDDVSILVAVEIAKRSQ